ncbi:MAG: hypothetical protein AAGU75_21910, partial [Bacillota bacterium]
FGSYKEGLKALNSQRKILQRLIEKHSCGGAVMGLSNCDGTRAQKINMNEGIVGRPKVGFAQLNPKQDYRLKWHIHAYIVGHKAATVAREFVEIENKQYHKKHPNNNFKHAFSQKKRRDGTFSLEYVEEQSQNMRFAGDREEIMKYVEERN